MSKACRTCGQLKPPLEYRKRPGGGLFNICKPCEAEYKRQWKAANKDKAKAWSDKNSKTKNRKLYLSQYRKLRRKQDPVFKYRCDVASRIKEVFRRDRLGLKTKGTAEILGCSPQELFAHLVQTALSNYGYWSDNEAYHIDHIIPLALAHTVEEIYALNHYSNLQLLTPRDNLAKGCKYLLES